MENSTVENRRFSGLVLIFTPVCLSEMDRTRGVYFVCLVPGCFISKNDDLQHWRNMSHAQEMQFDRASVNTNLLFSFIFLTFEQIRRWWSHIQFLTNVFDRISKCVPSPVESTKSPNARHLLGRRKANDTAMKGRSQFSTNQFPRRTTYPWNRHSWDRSFVTWTSPTESLLVDLLLHLIFFPCLAARTILCAYPCVCVSVQGRKHYGEHERNLWTTGRLALERVQDKQANPNTKGRPTEVNFKRSYETAMNDIMNIMLGDFIGRLRAKAIIEYSLVVPVGYP